jgi:tRNA-2-methylthio-N6-dimethylallyladenosine synthase
MQIKKERLHILTEELTKHTSEYNMQLIGKKLKVLVTGRDRKPGYLAGMTEGRIVVRFASADAITPGNFVWLDITSAAAYSVEGNMIKSEVGLQMTV